MSTEEAGHRSAEVAAKAEGRWATLAIIIVIVLAGMAAFAGIHQAVMPQARVETVDPTRLHIAGEFIESNLGSTVESDGSVTVRLIGQQYSFMPPCMVVPSETLITFRGTSADAVHGFLIEGTNINTMLVPGYVSVMYARFSEPGDHLMPCHEFCGVGHQGMWGRVKVVPKADFMAMSLEERKRSCVR